MASPNVPQRRRKVYTFFVVVVGSGGGVCSTCLIVDLFFFFFFLSFFLSFFFFFFFFLLLRKITCYCRLRCCFVDLLSFGWFVCLGFLCLSCPKQMHFPHSNETHRLSIY